MSPDDERHGTYRGYRAHRMADEVACGPCRLARNHYERFRKYDEQMGRPRLMPTHGLQRRFHALQALGWSGRAIAPVAGYSSDRHLQHALTNQTCLRRTWLAVAGAYELLSMKLPPERTPDERRSVTRVRNYARRQGWPPPLAWDDIDDPNEEPRGVRDGHEDEPDAEDWLDRILAGERPEPRLIKGPMRVQIVAMWPSTGLSINELERRTGWNPRRYMKKDEAA